MLNLHKNYLEKYQQISPENPEWNSIQYKLQLYLGNASAYIKRIYCVVNPSVKTQFEKDNKEFVTYDAFLRVDKMEKTEELSGSNRIERVCEKGFDFMNKNAGIEFTMGQVDIDPNQKSQFELLMVKICPNNSYPCNEQHLDYVPAKCPLGFQSLYYDDKNQAKKKIYKHRFRLYKKSQVLPLYIIQIAFNREHIKQLKSFICQNCRDEVAKLYCATEKVYFCKKCDYEHHKDKISSKHERKLLTDNPNLDFGSCKNHKNNKNQLFCETCSTSMCTYCKFHGDHAEGHMANHRLLKISDYYYGATKKIEEVEPNLSKRKHRLQKLLTYIGDQIDTICNKTTQLQNQLQKLFQKSLKQLHLVSVQKLSYLVSDQLQVRRQYDYISWMQSFLKYQKSSLPPNDFIIAWTKHEQLRKQVLNISNIPVITEVKPNMKISGSIVIEAGDGEIIDPGEEEISIEKFEKTNVVGKGPLDENKAFNNVSLRREFKYQNQD